MRKLANWECLLFPASLQRAMECVTKFEFSHVGCPDVEETRQRAYIYFRCRIGPSERIDACQVCYGSIDAIGLLPELPEPPLAV